MTPPQGRHETVQDRPTETTQPASRAARIEACLRRAFAPEAIAVEDDSARHFGHAGYRPEGETHYNVRLVAAAFRGQSRVARSRAVHAALVEEFAGGMHALSLRLLTPEEAAAER
ncbi:MAG: BolA family transcriptional regulator [Alphaproteobacteria bacterium]|nr:BolA family transcriptional regulator [Alphaproteobacteria bacterium]